MNTLKNKGTNAHVAIQGVYPATGKTGSFLFTADNHRDASAVCSPLFADVGELALWAKQNGFDALGYDYVFRGAPPATKLFRLVGKSHNTNSFGLRGHVFMARDGHAFEAARSDGSYHRRQFDDTQKDYAFELEEHGEVQVRVVDDGFEIPRRLPTAPANVINSVWSTK